MSGPVRGHVALSNSQSAGWDCTPAISREPARGNRESSDDSRRNSSGGGSRGDELATLQGAIRESQLKSSDRSNSLQSTATSKLKAKDLDCLRGRNNTHFDGSLQARGVYSGAKYLQGTVTWMAGAEKLGGDGTAPLPSLAASPTHDSAATIVQKTADGFAADTAFGILLNPLSLFATWTSYKDWQSARKRDRDPNLTDPHDKEINRLSMWENFFSFVSAGAFHIKTAIALGAKPFVLLSNAKGAGMFAELAGSGVVQGLGIAANFVLGPVAAVALMAEAAFSLRRFIRSKQAFKDNASEAKAFMDRMAKTCPKDMTPEQFAQFEIYKKEFFDRKYELRSSFWKRAKNMAWFRMGASAFFGATVATKFGIGIAALTAGGFLVSNPVGWALLGVTVVAAVLVTVGAFGYIYNRRRSRYEQYSRNDDPLVEKAFHAAVAKFWADHAPQDARVTAKAACDPSTKTPAQVPAAERHTQPSRTPPESHAEDTPLMGNGQPTYSAPPPRVASDASRRRRAPARVAPAELRSSAERSTPAGELMPFLDYTSSSINPTDGDDDDNNFPTVGNIGRLAHMPAATFQMIKGHQLAHGNLTERLATKKWGKPSKTTFWGRLANIGIKLRAWCVGSVKLLGTQSLREARKTSRDHWAKHARSLTKADFSKEILNGTRDWRDFMLAHLHAEKELLHTKETTRDEIDTIAKDIATATATPKTDLSAIICSRKKDTERLEHIDYLIGRIENHTGRVFDHESVPDPETNLAFLKILSNREVPDGLSEKEVTDSLARAIKTQYTRRIADLKGTLFEAELDCSDARMKVQLNRTPEPATARG